jgi:GTPase SAR1 family protein
VDKMMPNLILVEGLPGTGKSTWLSAFKQYFQIKDIPVKLFYEDASDHPVDFDGKACFTEDAFNSFQKNMQIDKLSKYIEKESSYIYFDYKNAKRELGEHFSDDLLNRCFKRDIYELPFPQYKEIMLHRWQRFMHKPEKNDSVYLFECTFLQNPLTKMVIQSNLPERIVQEYVTSVERLIERTKPLIIYLENRNIEKNFKKIYAERPEGWQKMFVDYYTNRGYGAENNLKGLNGTLKILKYRHALEQRLLKNSRLRSKLINTETLSFNSIPGLIQKALQ